MSTIFNLGARFSRMNQIYHADALSTDRVQLCCLVKRSLPLTRKAHSMRRIVIGLISFCTVVAFSLGSALGGRGGQATSTKVITGKNTNVWEYNGESSPKKATVGDPKGRLTVKVKKGDVVHFEVEGGQHGVIFERSKSDKMKNYFEVVTVSGELELQDPSSDSMSGVFLKPYYDLNDAQTTAKRGAGPIITVKIKELEPGLDKGILFGCNPHSRLSMTVADNMMLGVIVLDEESKRESKKADEESKQTKDKD